MCTQRESASTRLSLCGDGPAQGGHVSLSYDSAIQILPEAWKQPVLHTKIKTLNDKGERDP